MKKIAAKMIAVMRECSHIAKNGTNSFHGYTYATSADVLSKVNSALVEQGLASLVIPELISLEEVKTAKGNIEHLATVKVNITLIDRDSDESVLITGIGSGQDSGDKAVMKAQTAAIKYAYMLRSAQVTIQRQMYGRMRVRPLNPQEQPLRSKRRQRAVPLQFH